MRTALHDNVAATSQLWNAIRNDADGVTVDVTGSALPTGGFFVGGSAEPLVKGQDHITPDDVAGYVSTHPEARFFGLWREGDQYWLDCTEHYADADAAHSVARQRHEIAVYNITTGGCEQS